MGTLKRSGKDRGEEIQEISLDILLAHKDDIMTKLKNEYKTFLARKLEIESELVEVEKHELFLREQDIIAKKLELERVNEINKSHQSRFSEQLAILETKLEEHRLLHQQNEMKMQEEIDEMNKELDEVKSTLKKKIEELGSSDSDEDDNMTYDVNYKEQSSLSN